MSDILPVDNSVTIEIKGYRYISTLALVSNATITLTIYNSAGTSVITGTFTMTDPGDYSVTFNTSTLTAGSKYRILLQDTTGSPTRTVWTKWYEAQLRPI